MIPCVCDKWNDTFLIYSGYYIRQWAGKTNLSLFFFNKKKLKVSYPLVHFKVPLPIFLLGSPTLLFPPPGAQTPLLPAAEWLCCWRPAFTFSLLSAEKTLLTISHTLIKARTDKFLHTRIQIGILAACPKKTFMLQWILVGYLTLYFIEHISQGNGTSIMTYSKYD